MHETEIHGDDDDAWGWGWGCICGAGTDGYETADEADEDATDHERGY